MKVTVKKTHILGGIKKDSHKCMIADAIKECCPTARSISVDTQSIRFTDPKKRKRYLWLTPPAAQSSLLKFDAGRKVEPFTFTLRAPAVTLPVLNWKERGNRSRTPAQKKQRVLREQQVKQQAHLAQNRPTRDREFGLRKFVD